MERKKADQLRTDLQVAKTDTAALEVGSQWQKRFSNELGTFGIF